MVGNQQLETADAVHKITPHKNSGKVTLPKRKLKEKLDIDIEDIQGKNVAIRIDEDDNTIIIDLPTP